AADPAAEHQPLPKGRRVVASAAATAAQGRPPDTVAQKILRFIARSPVHIVLAVIGVMWLIPTLGLLVTSLLPPAQFNEAGWWKIFTKPSLSTFENYKGIWSHGPIPHSLWVTLQIAIGGTLLPILLAS